MRVVWKYPLGPTLTRSVLVSDPRVVFVGLDPASGFPAVWIEHTPDGDDPVNLLLAAIGTGHTIPAEVGAHVGSLIDGGFVWHIYSAVVT